MHIPVSGALLYFFSSICKLLNCEFRLERVWFVLDPESFMFRVPCVSVLQPDCCRESREQGYGIALWFGRCVVDQMGTFLCQSLSIKQAISQVLPTRTTLKWLHRGLGGDWVALTLRPSGNIKILWLRSPSEQHTLSKIIISVKGGMTLRQTRWTPGVHLNHCFIFCYSIEAKSVTD